MGDKASDTLAMLLTKPVTRLHGRPERADIDILEKEVARIVSTAKTTAFPQGEKYGHLVMIIGEQSYRDLIATQGFNYVAPTDPGSYDTVTIVGAVASNAASKSQAEAAHKRKQNEYNLWVAVESAARQLIVGAVDEELLVELCDDWVLYEGSTPSAIITFLRDQVCLAATTDDQLLLQAALNEPWDQTENLLSYFKKLDRAQAAMIKANVPCEDATKTIQASAQMTASGLFDERQITEWEERLHANKTWADLKTYYTRLYKSKMQYTKGDARRNGRESANAMLAKENEMQTSIENFMDSIQQSKTNNSEEINAIKEDQKVFVTLGEQLLSQMKMQQEVITKLSKRLDAKENSPPNVVTPAAAAAAAAATAANASKRESQKHLCPTCKVLVFHKPPNCPEINEAKRWPGWTTRL
jgi:hypothetical protein